MTNFFKNILAALIFLPSLHALAQSPEFSQSLSPTERPRSKVASVKEKLNGVKEKERVNILESLYGSDIDPSQENIIELSISTLAEKEPNERVAATRLLAFMHNPKNSHAANQEIRAKLRMLAQDRDKRVAVAALLRYTRLNYSHDSESLLDFNFSRGYIYSDDLFGELGHIAPFAPSADQARILDRIAKSGNNHALDIVASNFKNKEVRNLLSAKTKKVLLDALNRNQPKFSVAIGEFDMHEAIVYSDWLHMVALLTAETTARKYEDVILENIDGPLADPKRSLSYLSSFEGRAIANKIGSAKLNPVLQRISKYAASLPYPQHPVIKDLTVIVLSGKALMQ